MRPIQTFCYLLTPLISVAAMAQGLPTTTTISREQIISNADQTAAGQLAALAGQSPKLDWITGAMAAGYVDFAHVSSNAAADREAMQKVCEAAQWKLLTTKNDLFLADDFAIGWAMLDLYEQTKDPQTIADLRGRADGLVEHLKSEPANGKHLAWSWCDALFMAPPVLARLSAVTGDRKYIDAMDTEWWRSTARLYDKDERLFYRDAKFIGKLTQNGRKTFWSRGNGWVVAGICRTLEFMPSDYPTRHKYEKLLKDMLARLAELQQADGTWPASLLDPAEAPGPETSGTALNAYAFAWAIDHRVVERAHAMPALTKAYAALLAARLPDGRIGYVQAVGDRPTSTTADSTQPYANGAFLMVSAELSKLAPITLTPTTRGSR